MYKREPSKGYVAFVKESMTRVLDPSMKIVKEGTKTKLCTSTKK